MRARRRRELNVRGIPKALRGRLRRAVARRYGLSRRTLGAIGAGHVQAPDGYARDLANALALGRAISARARA